MNGLNPGLPLVYKQQAHTRFLFIALLFFINTAFAPRYEIAPITPKTSYNWGELPAFLKPKPESNKNKTSLQEALNPDGTLKTGIEGSFDPTGYNMSYAANGEPMFTPMPFGAGDEGWQSMPNLAQGVNGTVNAIAVTTSDVVYVGGSFSNAGGVSVNNIAVWDRGSWSALGTGVSGTVNAIALSGTNVIVGGDFTTAGGSTANRIALWNGSAWSSLGTGLSGAVRALAVNGSDVYAGGFFTTAGGNTANNIALWNGTAWSALGTGVNSNVNTITGGPGGIYVGGNFTTAGGASANRIALWNGSVWSALGTGVNNVVRSIATSGGIVYVGGEFSSAGGVSVSFVAQWNGTSWSAMGTGFSDIVNTIRVGVGGLYAGGPFITIGGTTVNRIARWNGTSWSAVGTGIAGSNNSIAVNAIGFGFTGDLHVGGNFTTTGAGASVNRVAIFKGDTWTPLGYGVNGIVNTVTVSGSNVLVGGSFTSVGGVSANNIARWNGTNWSTLGSGLNGTVRTIAVSGSDVYAGGVFTSAGGNAASNIAKWNGSAWSALGSGVSGGSFGTGVCAIAISNDNIFVGGFFSSAGGNSANRIARWNITNSTWNTLGTGVSGSTVPVVFAIAVSGSNVYAGGSFTTAGGNSANSIALWNGSAWSALGTGISGGSNPIVFAIATSGSAVYAGGDFTTAGGTSANRIALWNGSNWSALGNGVDNIVNALALRGDNTLYVGGDFITAGGVVANRIAVWNGNAWAALGTGLNGSVKGLAVSGTNVYPGGDFTSTGDGSVAATNIIQRNGVFPTATLQAPQIISNPTGVKLNGTVNSGNLAGTYYFEYGTASGNLNQQTSSTSMSGSSNLAVNTDVFAAAANTTYFYRLRAENPEGISYSSIQSYTFPPDIEVRQSATVLSTGSEYDFGGIDYLASSSAVPFTLFNLGLGDLNLTGGSVGNRIVKGGPHSADFTVVQTSIVSPVAYNTNQPFTVQFNPQAGGVRTATLTITSNDPDEPSYVINLKGTGVKLNQTINFNALAVKTIGEASFALTATASSGLPVSYTSATPTVATVSGNTVTLVGPGTTVITASQAGNANYNAATNIQQTLIVRAAEPASQPTALTFNNITIASINGAFTSASGSPTGYIILSKQGSAPTFTPVDGTTYSPGVQGDSFVVAAGSATSFSHTGLAPGVTYHYAVFAFNGTGQAINYRTSSPLSNSVITVPAAPAAITASPVGQTSFTARWAAVTGAASYSLDVSSDNFSTLLSNYSGKSVSGLSDNVTGLTPGTAYQYRVRAINASGVSTNSNTINQFTVPATPVAVEVTTPGATSFTASWNTITGVTGYELDVSTNNFTTFIPGYNARTIPATTTQELVSPLSSSTAYQYRVRALNSGGSSPYSNTVTVTTLSGAGALTVSNPTFTNSATASISITLSNGSGSRIVKFYSRGILESDFRVPVTLTSASNTYTTTLTPSLLDEMGLEFYFTAEDASTPTPIRSPETGNSYIYTPVPANTNIPGLSFGGELKNYRIISIPYALNTNNTPIVFSTLGAYDKTKWRLLQLSGTAYADNPGTITPGRGYWFNARQSTIIELGEGTVVRNNQTTPYTMQLQEGWNMIATPFPFAIDWDDVRAANPAAQLDPEYFVFNPSTIGYSTSNSLNPFEGGFVYAETATSLTIPVLLKNTSGGREQNIEVFEKNLDAINWHLPITLRQGEVENSLGAVGMHEEAKPGKDRFDRVALPAFLNYVQLTTQHPDAHVPDFIRDVVPPQKTYVWNFALEASTSGPIELQWDANAIKHNQAQLLLYDQAQGILIDMRTKGTYTTTAGDDKKIQIIYTQKEHTDLIREIGKPYPNPFSTTVKLPGYFNAHGESTRISVSIVSLTGTEVYQHHYISTEKGLHQPQWNGETTQGETITSGLYIFKVIYNNDTTTLSHQGKILKQ